MKTVDSPARHHDEGVMERGVKIYLPPLAAKAPKRKDCSHDTLIPSPLFSRDMVNQR